MGLSAIGSGVGSGLPAGEACMGIVRQPGNSSKIIIIAPAITEKTIRIQDNSSVCFGLVDPSEILFPAMAKVVIPPLATQPEVEVKSLV